MQTTVLLVAKYVKPVCQHGEWIKVTASVTFRLKMVVLTSRPNRFFENHGEK